MIKNQRQTLKGNVLTFHNPSTIVPPAYVLIDL